MGSVSASTQDTGIQKPNIQCCTKYYKVKENNLGITISADMKVSEQCGIAAVKGNQILGLSRRNIVYKEKELIIPLYKTIVRLHLEYRIQAWRPYCKKYIDYTKKSTKESNQNDTKTQAY